MSTAVGAESHSWRPTFKAPPTLQVPLSASLLGRAHISPVDHKIPREHSKEMASPEPSSHRGTKVSSGDYLLTPPSCPWSNNREAAGSWEVTPPPPHCWARQLYPGPGHTLCSPTIHPGGCGCSLAALPASPTSKSLETAARVTEGDTDTVMSQRLTAALGKESQPLGWCTKGS